jgi:transposase
MTRYVGLDVSLKETKLHVLDEAGNRIWRGRCATDAAAIVAAVRRYAPTAVRIGLETGPLTTWLWTALRAEGLPMVCLDARHGAWLGLTPRRFQSGEVDYDGHISRRGDRQLRALLYEAAAVLLTRVRRESALRRCGAGLHIVALCAGCGSPPEESSALGAGLDSVTPRTQQGSRSLHSVEALRGANVSS